MPLLGNEKLGFQDLYNVAVRGEEVTLNPPSLTGMTATAFTKGRGADVKLVATFGGESDTKTLDAVNTRAVMLVRLNSLLCGRLKIRAEFAVLLSELLNHNILPVLGQTSALADLAKLMLPFAEGYSTFQVRVPTSQTEEGQEGPFELQDWGTVMTSFNLTAVSQLYGTEYKTFVHNLAMPVALLALNVFSAELLVDLLDCAGGFACETVTAPSDAFKINTHNVCRPHRAQSKSAQNLKLMLDRSGWDRSKITKKSKQALSVFQHIPELHGAIRRQFTSLKKEAKVELNSAENGQYGNFALDAVPFHANPLIALLSEFITMLLRLTAVSHTRATELKFATVSNYATELKLLQDSTAALAEENSRGPADYGYKVAMQLSQLLEQATSLAQTVLLTELGGAFNILSEQNAVTFQKAVLTMAKKAAAKAAREDKLRAAGKAIPKQKGAPKAPKGKQMGTGSTRLFDFITAQANTAAVAVAAAASETSETKTQVSAVVVTAAELSVMLSTLPARALVSDILTSKNSTIKPKLPKGTRDGTPAQMHIREACFKTIKDIFKRHGAVGIDTPVFEMTDTLMGKYGEDSKLIFDLADQGGEQYSLRYDLTVPFARYVSNYGIQNIKRYHIAKVYRRDTPAPAQGRFREFYQCDFDIAGEYPTMMADAEVLKVLCEILTNLKIGNFSVKLSHRLLLDALMDVCGVPAEKFRTICSAVDKLDKKPWAEVKHEMVFEKGITEETADLLGSFVCRDFEGATPLETLAALRAETKLSSHPDAKKGLDELEILFTYLRAFGCLDQICFDLSLARGLDYYTGLIYEAVFIKNEAQKDMPRIGSIAAGGRYDKLVGMFSSKDVPSVGVSIGIERVLAILEYNKKLAKSKRTKETQVLVASIGKNMTQTRMELCKLLWDANINTEMVFHDSPKPVKQLTYCLENYIPVVVWVGQTEVENDVFNVKHLAQNLEVPVARADLVTEIQKMLANTETDTVAISAEEVPEAKAQ